MLKRYFIILFITLSVSGYGGIQAQDIHSDVNHNADSTITKKVQKGLDQLESGDLDKAVDIFKNILEISPDHPEANYRLGSIYMRQEKPEEGIEFLENAVMLDPVNVAYHMTLAKAYEFVRQYNKAIEQYEKVARLAESDTEEQLEARKKIDYLKATQYATKGEVDKALPIFAKLADKFPDDTLIQYSLGLAYLFKKKLEKSEAIFTKLIDLTPENPNVYLNLATIYEQQGELQKATDNLRKVLEISPQGRFAQQAHQRLGIIEGRLLMREGNLQEALDTLNQVIEISPDNTIALFNIAEVYQSMGQLSKAEQYFRKVIELAPRDLEARLRLAGLYVETDRLDQGTEALQEIINLDKESPQAQKATELLQRLMAAKKESVDETQRMQLSVERYQNLINADPNNLEAHLNLGRIYYRQGKFEAARRELEEVVRINPDNKPGQTALAALYDEMGLYDLAVDKYSTIIALEEDKQKADEYKELMELASAKKMYTEGSLGLAREQFEEIVTKDPDSAIAYFYLGLINSSEDELSKAVEDYEEVIRLIPGHSGARLNLAINLERLHREEDAISQYRKILEAGPPSSIAETAEKRLLAAEKRISGLSTGLSYSLASDSNTNLSDTNPADDIRSDLSVNISYQHKLENGVRLRLSTTPTYSTYHIGNFDYLNTSSSISATLFPARYTFVGGYTNRTNRGLVTSNRFSGSDVLFGEGSTRIRLPKIFSPFSDENVTSDLSLNLSYTDFESDSNPIFSAYIYSFGFGINQPYGDNSAVNLGYSYTINDNKYNDTLSQDYAYRSQGVNIGFQWLVAPGFSANARYSYNLVDYSNLDSVSQFTEYRKNERHVFSFGSSYRYHEKIRFFANVSWTYNNSNLPVGFVLNAQDVIEGLQSGSLGEYKRGIVTLGMNLFI